MHCMRVLRFGLKTDVLLRVLFGAVWKTRVSVLFLGRKGTSSKGTSSTLRPAASSSKQNQMPAPRGTGAPPLRPLLSKLICEFLGTTAIVFIYGVAGSAGLTGDFAITIGATVTAITYAGGHLTGGLYNPAITVATAIRGKIDFGLCCAYIAIQLCAGLLGALSSMCLKYGAATGFIGHPTLGEDVSDGSACLAEIVVTFALCHTFLHVATTVTQANNSYYGLATGLTVLSGTISVGGVSGACFNPAVAMLTLVHKWQMWSQADFASFEDITTGADKVWIHVLGPLVGAIFAGVLFLATHPRELDGQPAVCPGSIKPREAAAPLLIEFVGTFFIAFTYACATVAAPQLGQLAAFSVGCMAAAQIYAGGVTSGAHYNPAITLAVLVRRKLVEYHSSGERLKQRLVTPLALMFMAVQSVAALCAGGVARAVMDSSSSPIGFPALQRVTIDDVDTVFPQGRAFFGEMVATSVLAYVVLHSITSEKTTGKPPQYFNPSPNPSPNPNPNLNPDPTLTLTLTLAPTSTLTLTLTLTRQRLLRALHRARGVRPHWRAAAHHGRRAQPRARPARPVRRGAQRGLLGAAQHLDLLDRTPRGRHRCRRALPHHLIRRGRPAPPHHDQEHRPRHPRP